MIRNYRYLVGTLIAGLGIVLGIRGIHEHVSSQPPATRSPAPTSQTRLTTSSPPQSTPSRDRSLTELYQLRDRLQGEANKFSTIFDSATFVTASEYQSMVQRRETLLAQIHDVDAQIQGNKNGQASWDEALNRAAKAAEMGRSPHPSAATWQKAKFFWEKAIASLREIPPNSVLKTRADRKIKDYQKHLSDAKDELAKVETQVLGAIVKQSGLSSQAMVTICNLSGDCSNWNGDRVLAKPASLNKIPIAVALLHKVSTEHISLNTPINVTAGNFTEDGSAQIQVGHRYPLKTLLTEMITHSSNIAGNQLIDYLGWDYIKQVLKQRGYRITRVGSKFIGQRVAPANIAKGGSILTSNELTQMMVETYNRKHPGDEVLIDALHHQHNPYLGLVALKSTPARWLGEKTGESSTVQGTTFAFRLAGETYILTAIDTPGNREANIRRCIVKLVNYIAQHSYL
ncbi:MAG TPA: serine hydrolase [Chroococcales cyanobacterium]